MGEEVCLLLCMERNFVLLPTVTWQRICGHVTTWLWMEFVCDNVTILEAWNVASSRLMEFVFVKCWLVV